MSLHQITDSQGRRRPSPIFVFDSPRTCSQLFRKLFLQHPQLSHILEPFLFPSVLGYEGVIDRLQCNAAAKNVVEQMREAVPEFTASTYIQANETLKQGIQDSEQRGEIPWIKDHALYSVRPEIILDTIRSHVSLDSILEGYLNPTLIDEDLLHSFTPIFLIRHPALVVQSYYEVNSQSIGSDIEDEQFAWMTCVRWVRIMFGFYRRHRGEIPLLVDAHDIIHRTEELTDLLCDRLGLDRRGVVSAWEPEPLSEAPGEFFKKRLRASRGVERDGHKSEGPQFDVNAMSADWTAKYGKDVSDALRQRVEAELPDYQYLHQFKLLS